MHIDTAEVRTEQGKLQLFRRHRSHQQICLRPAAREGNKAHRRRLPARRDRGAALQLHTVLTDNGVPFTYKMNRTLKDATLRRYHHASHDEFTGAPRALCRCIQYGRRLKALRGLTPYEAVCQSWTREPSRFISNPFNHTSRLNIWDYCHHPYYTPIALWLACRPIVDLHHTAE